MADNQLLTQIEAIHEQSRRTYGSPRIHAVLREQGVRCGCKRVARLMRQAGVQVRRKRSDKVTTQSNHDLPVAANLLKQQFTADQPNQVWLADITYIATAEPGSRVGHLLSSHCGLVYATHPKSKVGAGCTRHGS